MKRAAGKPMWWWLIMLLVLPLAAGAAEPSRLVIFAAGTLAVPFRAVDDAFQKRHPEVEIQAQFGGSVKMTKKITELHQQADLLATADYSVIPKYLFHDAEAKADWYIGFARNAITFVYTPKSRFAEEINPQNWYRVLSRKGVQIGRSDPDTDPSGYQTLQMLDLAASYYRKPSLAAGVLANAPRENMRDTETSLLAALQIGQIDYLAIYRSDALQHHLHFLDMPPAINLSDPSFASAYAKAVVRTKNGELAGKPIVYALTIPGSAANPALAVSYIHFLLGPEGRKILVENGFETVAPAFAVGTDSLPGALRTLVKPWPAP